MTPVITISERETALENENARLWQELFAAREQMEKQRKVLEQAMMALEHAKDCIGDELPLPMAATDCDNSITAIQEQLK